MRKLTSMWRWKLVVTATCLLYSTGLQCQSADSSTNKSYKPEILSSGFIDVINNGQLNASARFIRLYIGEPGRIAIPLSFYSGVSANNFSSSQSAAGLKSNDHLVNNFINPLSGLVNV